MNVIELYQKAIDKSTSGWRNAIWFCVKFSILAFALNALVIISFPFLLPSFYLGVVAVFLSIDAITAFTVFTFDAIMFSFNQEIKMPSELEHVSAESSLLINNSEVSLSHENTKDMNSEQKITNPFLEGFQPEDDIIGMDRSSQYGIIKPFEEVDGSNLAKMHKHAQVDEGFFDDESSQYGIIKPFEEVESSNVVKAHTHIKVEKGFFDEDPSDVNMSLEQAVEILDRQDLENGGGYADLIPDEPAEPMKFGR